MYGNWEYDDNPLALMDYEAILDLFTNTIEPSEIKYITADIARFGQDKTILMLWNGLEVSQIETFKLQSLDVTGDKIREMAHKHSVPFSRIIVDEDGVGGGVVDIVKGIKGFIGNSSPFENKRMGAKENYRNLRSQCYCKLAQLVNDRQIKLNCDSQVMKQDIIQELEQISLAEEVNSDSKIKVIGKDLIKESIGRSPDYADSLMMRMYFEYKKVGESLTPFNPRNNLKYKLNPISY